MGRCMQKQTWLHPSYKLVPVEGKKPKLTIRRMRLVHFGWKNFQPPTHEHRLHVFGSQFHTKNPQSCPRIPSRKVFSKGPYLFLTLTKARPGWGGINSEQLVRGNRLKTGCLNTSNGRWLTNEWSRYSQDEAGKTCLGLEQLVTHLSHMPKTTHPRKLVPLPPNFFIARTDIFLLYSCETKYLFYTFLSSSFPLTEATVIVHPLPSCDRSFAARSKGISFCGAKRPANNPKSTGSGDVHGAMWSVFWACSSR
jgi:hypothetical protein